MVTLKPFGYIILLVVLLCAFTSCQRQTMVNTDVTANKKNIAKTTMSESPLIADLTIDVSHKISGSASSSDFGVSVDEIKKLAVYNALSKEGAQVLANASYQVTTTRTKKTVNILVVVEGWPAKYASIAPVSKGALASFQCYQSMFTEKNDPIIEAQKPTEKPTPVVAAPPVVKEKAIQESPAATPIPKKDTVEAVATAPTPSAPTPTPKEQDDIAKTEPESKEEKTTEKEKTEKEVADESDDEKEEAPPVKKAEPEQPAPIAPAKPTPTKPAPVKETPAKETNSSGLVFKIQLMASKVKISKDKDPRLASLPDFEIEQTDYFRYFTGHFGTVREAQTYLIDVQKRGFPQAFVVAYKNGVKTSLNAK